MITSNATLFIYHLSLIPLLGTIIYVLCLAFSEVTHMQFLYGPLNTSYLLGLVIIYVFLIKSSDDLLYALCLCCYVTAAFLGFMVVRKKTHPEALEKEQEVGNQKHCVDWI